MNPFNRFYDTQISVFASEENTYSKKGERTLVGTLVCDLQPYTSDTESKIYGLDHDRRYKVFCDTNDFLKVGRHVFFGGEWYMVVSIERWRMGMTALIRGEENDMGT